jgi:prephenate dehydrogenase
MGGWMAGSLAAKAMIFTDRPQSEALSSGQRTDCQASTRIESASGADSIIISVSIDAFEEVVCQLATFTRQEQAIYDVTSIKVMPVEIMHRHIKRGTILGTHPVFGPGARNLEGHNLVLTPTNQQEQLLAEKAALFLNKRGARVHIMTPDEHDHLMSVILGLAHFISIVSASTLSDLGGLKELSEVQGITYRALLTLVESVLSENAELYASLQMNLPYLNQVQQVFIHNAQLWTDIVSSQDRQAFISRMNRLREHFGENNPGFGQAYDNMYRLAGN